MDARGTTPPPPSICISHLHRSPSAQAGRNSPPHCLHTPALPMSIPNTPRATPVPPPLPPPQHPDIDDDAHIGQTKGWDWFNRDYISQHFTDFGKASSVKPGSSLLGGKRHGAGAEADEIAQEHEIDPARRGSSISTVTPIHGAPEVMIDTTPPGNKDDLGSRLLNHRCVSTSSIPTDPFL